MAAEVDSPVSPSEYEKLTGKQEKLQDTVFGKAKRWSVLDRKEWAFLIISTVSILGVAAMTIFRVIGAARGDITNDSGLCESNEERLRDLFFAIILLLNLIFLLFYAWHGVIREREFELWAFIGAVIILAVYIFWSFFVTPQTTVKIIRLVFFAAGSVPVVILAYSVSREFRWLEFRIVGADPILQGMYRSYSRCTTLLLFDVQVAASLLVLVYHPKLHASLAEQITIPLLVALTLLMACDVFVGIVTERSWMVYAWGVFALLEPIYIALKCVLIGLEWTDSDMDRMMAGIVYAIAAIAIVVRGFLAYYVDVCYHNFGFGLKERAFIGVDARRS